MPQATVPTVRSLLERGQYFLQQEQFKAAQLYFNRVLDAAPDTHEAHWGLLLCELQCKTTAELYTVNAVPLDAYAHYHDAVKRADPTAAAHYRAVLDASLVACHARVLNYYEADNLFLINEWQQHYRASAAKNAAFDALHKLGQKGHGLLIFDEALAPAMLAFDRLYDEIDTSLPEMPALVEQLRQAVRRIYTHTMSVRLNKLSQEHPADTAKMDTWASPSEDAKARIGLDSNGNTPNARYIALATALEKSARSTKDYESILYCYDRAAAVADSDEAGIAENAKISFCARIAGKSDATDETLLFFMQKFPQNGALYSRYVELLTDNFSKPLTAYVTDDAADAFLRKRRDDYTDDKAQDLLHTQKTRMAACEKEYADLISAAKPYADKALLLLHDAQTFEESWQAYCARIQREREQILARLQERHRKVAQKLAEDRRSGASSAVIKGILATVASYLTVCVSVPMLLCALYTIKHPLELLGYGLIPTFLFAIGGCIVLFLIKNLITRALKNYRPKKYALPKACTVLLKLAPVLALVFSLACVTTFAYSFFAFPVNAGVIPITSADELVYIKNAPHADFILAENITVEEGTAPKLSFFFGSIDGDGHTLSGVTVDEHVLGVNYGTVQNLTVQAPVYADDGTLVRKNRGTLRNVTVSNLTLNDEELSFIGFTERNTGRIESCSLRTVKGTCQSFVGIAEKNKGEIYACSVTDAAFTAASDVAGIVGVNEKLVGGCSFTGNVTGSSVYGLTRVLRKSGATVEQCFTGGNYNAGNSLSGLIGSAEDDVLVQNCYSTAKLTLTPAQAANTYAIGLVGAIDRIDDDKCVTVRNCYFGGSIITKKGPSGDRYGFVGATVGNTAPFGGSSSYTNPYYIDFDGCFAAAAYNFGVSRSYDSEGALPIKTETSYFTSVHDISEILMLYNDTNYAKRNTLLTQSFLVGTMGWDEEIWVIQNGKLPTLKPYVIPDEPIEVDTTSEEVAP